jgi:hypothetical protein
MACKRPGAARSRPGAAISIWHMPRRSVHPREHFGQPDAPAAVYRSFDAGVAEERRGCASHPDQAAPTLRPPTKRRPGASSASSDRLPPILPNRGLQEPPRENGPRRGYLAATARTRRCVGASCTCRVLPVAAATIPSAPPALVSGRGRDRDHAWASAPSSSRRQSGAHNRLKRCP